MTETETTETPSPDPASPVRRWKLIAGLAVAGAVLAVGAAAFAIARDDSGSSGQDLSSQRIAATQNACQQWLDDYTASTDTAPHQGWCGYMSDWMRDRMASGQMMGPGMWGDPAAMYGTCVQAMGSYQPAVDDPAQWCQSMVDWMTQHRGDWMHDDWDDWDDWDGMMNPSMMGR